MPQAEGSGIRIAGAPLEGLAEARQDLSRAKLSGGRGSESTSRSGGVQVGRIAALDFIKGALVLIMVLYHWLNYFVGPQGFFYRYLTFLPPSFICITGFLISQVYLSKYRITDARLPRRLAIRGIKILAIFILLNAAIRVAIPRTDTGKKLFDILSPATLWSVYVSGNMRGGRPVAFFVLVPISYLLICSACLLIACRYYKYAFHVATALAVLGVVLLNVKGQLSQNLEMLSIGFLGISIGYIPIDKINQSLKRPYSVLLAYIVYVLAITVWNTPYPLQVTGVLLTLMVLYLVGTLSGDNGWIQRTLILLGQYSLLGYIEQIAILQALRRALRAELAGWALVLSFVAAVFLTAASVVIVDRARSRVRILNRLYGAVFS
jgi:peptidoglycan/LPS O-acetylase OafA/YrhL